jgi:transposase
MSMAETRKYRSGEEILRILKRHLVDKEELSKVCEAEGICPSQFYRWQAILFAEGAAVFERKSAGSRKERLEALERVAMLEEKIQKKNEVLSELMEEQVRLKKGLGEA